jgi:hypothetical protein
MLLFPEDEPAGILFKVKITNNYTNHDGGADDGDYGIRRFRLYAHFNSEDIYNRWTTIDIEKNIELPLYAEDGAFVYVPFTDFKYDVGNQLAWDAGALLRIGFYWQYQNTTDNNEDIIVELQDLMIVGEVASGIQTISESKLKVYADESSVHLSNAIANDRIEIFNAQGQKMYSGCAIEGKNSIPFNQSKGLYMLKLKDKIVKFIR